MEHTGIDPVTSGLQSPGGGCGHCLGQSAITGVSRGFLQVRYGD